MKSVITSIIGLVSLAACGVSGLWLSETAVPASTNRHARIAHQTQRITLPDNSSRDDSADNSDARQKLARKVEMLQKGDSFLRGVAGYTAVLRKQEMVGDELLPEQEIEFKCRHQPFSVYLHWITGDKGREVIYIEGQNNGKMIAHDGGWKARLPAFSLDPECRLAMRDTRCPVSTAGMLYLTQTMLSIHQDDLAKSNVASCQIATDQSFDGRACTVFTTTYKSPAGSPEYRKSITYIDDEWNIPVYSQHFEWPATNADLNEADLDNATLIESYSFSKIQMNAPLADRDFDRSNPEYRFR